MKIKSFFLIIPLIWGSCQSGNQSDHDHHHGHHHHDEHEHDHDIVEVTEAQKKLAKIVIGKPEKRWVKEYLSCTGLVDLPPESLADISAPLGGFVRKAPFYEGAFVKKGQVLVGLVHPEYIRLQQAFLETESQLAFLQQDRTRQKILREGEAASDKRVQEIQSSYESMKARRDGLAAQLRIAGVNITSLKENGISEMIYLRAPFSGIISMTGVNYGKQVGPEEVLYQMYDPTHLHLELQVFPRDIDKIRIGDSLRYQIQGSAAWHKGHIVLLGGGVHPEMRTIRVHAHPDSMDPQLRPGTFIQAEIEIDREEVLTLPETAFQVEEGKYFVFKVIPDGFKKTPVKIGRKSDGYIEVLTSLPGEYVVEGAYYLAEVDESDHDH
ncbi:MAG: efflux RND transporter periplasmic adaptor subunit [Cryomorphaceae bacterium]|nr:efflux RND transporter periplasmic adaptor subunit [Cryomorphaceae bacterium]